MKKILALLALLVSIQVAQAQDCGPRVCYALSTPGNLAFSNTRGEAAGLPIGTAGQVLVVDATGIPQWKSSEAITDLSLSGNLTFTAASAKIIPGSTSLLIRNNADTATNITILDAGTTSFRGGIRSDGASNWVVGQGTVSNSDNKATSITGAVLASSADSGYADFFGNEFASVGGSVGVHGGNVATGNVGLSTSNTSASVTFGIASGATAWSIPNAGTLVQDATNGGDIVISKGSTAVRQTVVNGITTAGSTVTDATQLTGVVNRITSATLTQGVKLWDAGGGAVIYVVNNGGATANLYPSAAGDTIQGHGAGAAATLLNGAIAICSRLGNGNSIWNCVSGTAL